MCRTRASYSLSGRPLANLRANFGSGASMVVTKDQPTTNTHLLDWVEEMERLCKPDDAYWVDGSDDENKRLTEKSVSDGVLIPLNQTKRPNSFYSRSNPNDLARVGERAVGRAPTQAGARSPNSSL